MVSSTINTCLASESSGLFVLIHHSASDFLDVAESQLQTREREANTIYPQARKLRSIERASGALIPRKASFEERTRILLGAEGRASYRELEHISGSQQMWITQWSTPLSPSSSPVLDFALSCTRSEIDNLPIFLWSSYETSTLTKSLLSPRLTLLSQTLAALLPTSRVFSVYASSLITKTFADCWYNVTGIETYSKPYYEAALTYLTRNTLSTTDRNPGRPRLPFTLRKATMGDVELVAEQCEVFASDSDFPIDSHGAHVEATTYIKRGQLYVCEVELPTGVRELASIVAVTRNTDRHATITKVHTNSQHRKRGYAEALVRYVCSRLLYAEERRFGRSLPDDVAPYDSVALYVAHDNIAAATVYDRVGFAGLLGKERPAGVEDMLELGFKDAIKGYW